VRATWGPLLVLMAAGAGCARHVASQVTSGALESLDKPKGSQEDTDGGRPSEQIASHAVEAAVAKLSSPEQMAELRRVAAAAAEAAVERALQTALEGEPSPVDRLAAEAAGGFRESLSSGLAGDLGERGPLATSISGTVRLAAASATDGAVGRLFPGCTAGDSACLERRLAALSEEAAFGFGAGLKKSLGLPALVLAFLAGAAATLMVLLLIQLEVRRREHHQVARAH
jgi:hypothetical protein